MRSVDNSNIIYKHTVRIKSSYDEQSVTATLACPDHQVFVDGKFPKEKCVKFCPNLPQTFQLKFSTAVIKQIIISLKYPL